MQDVLETLQELFLELHLIAYADSIYLQGSGEQVFTAYKELAACATLDINRGDLLGVSVTRMVQLDVTFVHTTGMARRTQGRTRRHSRVSRSAKRPRENTMRRWAHRGIRTQRWHMRLMAVWETKQQNRSGCKRMRHAALLPYRDWRLLGTSKPNLVLLQSRAIPLCSMHLPVGPKDGQGVSKRSDMPTCRSRIDHVSH